MRVLLLSLSTALLLALSPAPADAPPSMLTVEDFQAERAGAAPSRWVYVLRDGSALPAARTMGVGKQFTVQAEGGNRYLRLQTRDAVQRITLGLNRTGAPRWAIRETPLLSWRWRARRLPPGARESSDSRNDVGGAIYVTFGRDWIGRPKSIKYTYSSTLPVGTTLRQGSLRVLVVSTGADGIGTWQRVSRDVRADYARLFGEPAPDPVGITLWSDTDTTRGEADVDTDDLAVSAPGR